MAAIAILYDLYRIPPVIFADEDQYVEELEVLLAKGETDKEIYTIERLQAEKSDLERQFNDRSALS